MTLIRDWKGGYAGHMDTALSSCWSHPSHPLLVTTQPASPSATPWYILFHHPDHSDGLWQQLL